MRDQAKQLRTRRADCSVKKLAGIVTIKATLYMTEKFCTNVLRQYHFEALFKKRFRRKITTQLILTDMMQPFHYNLRCPAAKDNSITHAAVAPSNLDAAITMRSADTELLNTRELPAKALEIAAPQPDLDAKGKKNTILKHSLKRVLKGKSSAPKSETSRDKSLSQT